MLFSQPMYWYVQILVAVLVNVKVVSMVAT